ncbi:MAG: IS1634 family transposase [Bacteroidia bacterium]
MFVRKKKNKSGVISIQIIDKSSGRYELYRTVGSSDNKIEIEKLLKDARKEIETVTGQPSLPFDIEKEKELLDIFFNGIEDFKLTGPELLLGKIYDEIGFNKIPDELFRHLVITRLVYPVSKLKTVDYLFKYKGIVIDVERVYRYLDKLQSQQMKQIQQISYEHTLKVLNNQLSVVFYDVTTLYFEAAEEDSFRQIGFSKDGKHQQPQIVLGLLVSSAGYPLAYELFEGSKFEGHTMIPVIESFKKKFQLEKLIVIADAGLLSAKNIKALCELHYEFILGARIKNETESIKQKILSLKLADGQSRLIKKSNGEKLIVSYSVQRAKNDEYNRTRGLRKLEKALAKGTLTKKHINNKGYNKYLILDGEVNIRIDYDKFKEDKKWDGLKGYLTNTKLTKETIIESYKQLWYIEKAFRISKSDLRIRPIFHHLKRRIEAHICIAFVSCKIYKELERQLYLKKATISPEKAINILKTIYSISITTPYSYQKHTRLLVKNKEQSDLLKLFDLE